jgi:hypothetical protein
MCQVTSSSLESVTVYRAGAVCVRRADVAPSEKRRVRITGLPLSMEPGSLRVRAPEGGVSVVDARSEIDVQLVGEVDVPAEQKALEAAEQTLQRLRATHARLERESSELRSLRPRFGERRRGEPPAEAHVGSLLALTDFLGQELVTRQPVLRGLECEIEDAEREVELRRHRLAEASTTVRGERTRLSRAVVVTLSEAPQQTVELSVEYQVRAARWVPAYQLRLQPGMAAGQLAMRAYVAQCTGEDWTSTRLALSTASLMTAADLPELRSLRIGRAQAAPPRSGWREPPTGLDDLFAAYDEARPAEREVEHPKPVAAAAAPQAPVPCAPASVAAPAGIPFAGAMARASAEDLALSESAEDLAMEEAAPPAMMMRQSRAPAPVRAAMTRASHAFPAAPEEPPPPEEPPVPELELGDDFSDYGRLRMAGPDSPRRGRLLPLSERELTVVTGVAVEIEVVMQATIAVRDEIAYLDRLPLPAQACPVGPIACFDYRYDCAGRATVPSTVSWTGVAVGDCDVGLGPRYLCVPGVDEKVYRTLDVQNRSSHALLPGPVDVSLGDRFLLTTQLPAIPPQATCPRPLGLGVEEAIKVARQVHFKETSGGLLGGSTQLQHEIEIELRNQSPVAAACEVRERVPWANPDSEKDVKVEETFVEPAWQTIEEPLDGEAVVHGARVWRVTLPPGKHQVLHARFTIRIPSDRMLVGGNRRS